VKTILHIIGESSYDGITIYTTRLIRSLPEYNHKIISMVEGKAITEIQKENICIINLFSSADFKFYKINKYIKFIRELLKTSFDIIHYHNGGVGTLFLATLLSKNRVIHHIHSGSISGNNKTYDLTPFQKYGYKILCKFNYNIFVSNHIHNLYKKTISKIHGNSSVILNSVPFNFKLKEKTNNVVGYLGRVTEEKGISVLVELIDSLDKNKSNIKFNIKGEIEKSIYNKLSFLIQNEKVIYEKPSMDVENFLSKIDILIFPSKATEGLPLVVLEAVSSDVAVIAVKTDWSIEVLGHEYPFLVENLSISSILFKIDEYYSGRQKSQISQTHSKILTKYRFDNMINQINDIYKKI